MSTDASFSQAKHLLTLFDQKGISSGQFEMLKPYLSDLCDSLAGFDYDTCRPPARRDLFRRTLHLPPSEVDVSVLQIWPLEDTIKHYEQRAHIIGNVSYNVTFDKEKEWSGVKVRFIPSRSSVSPREMKKIIAKKKGVRPCDTAELLWLGRQHQDLLNFRMVALGSVSETNPNEEVLVIGHGDCDQPWADLYMMDETNSRKPWLEFYPVVVL